MINFAAKLVWQTREWLILSDAADWISPDVSKEIETIKKEIENGHIGDQKSFNQWTRTHIRKQRSDNSDSIDAEDRSANANNDRLDLQTPEGKPRRGQGNQNSPEDFGTGFIRVYNNDGTNGPRYVPIPSRGILGLYQTPEGEVYGFVDKDGNMYLDETIIDPSHPIHEYTHLWDRALEKNNPKLWKRGVKFMQEGLPALWNEIASLENSAKRLDNCRRWKEVWDDEYLVIQDRKWMSDFDKEVELLKDDMDINLLPRT